MKKLIMSIAAMVIALAASTQPVATEGKVEFQKGDKAAAIIELPYPPNIVEDAIKEHLAKKGIKPDKAKGFDVYRGARLTDTDPELTDLYFKVDRKSRQEKNTSMVYLISGRPNENIALRTTDDTHKLYDGKTFLNELIPSIESHNLEMTINQQEETLKKAEKKLRNLEDDQKDIEGKIQNLEDKLARIKKDQETQNAEINKERAVRDAMISRRKS